MSNYFLGEIEFPRSALEIEEVAKIIEGYSIEDEEENLIFLRDAEARNGEFEDLESLLVKLKIPFDRYSESHGNYDSEARSFRPKTKKLKKIDITTYGNAEGRPYITTALIRKTISENPTEKAIEILKAYLEEKDPQIPGITDYIVSEE